MHLTDFHTMLLEKLQSCYNFDTNAVNLIRSYLTLSSQQISNNNNLSDKLAPRRGVPQGSILGPLLFLLFFNDFVAHIGNDVVCLLYADDATLLVRGSDYTEVAEKCERALERAREWCCANELCLNQAWFE